MRKDEAAQAAAEAEAAEEAARIAEGEANPAQPGDADHAASNTGVVGPEQGGSPRPDHVPAELDEQEEPEGEVEAYPLTTVTPEMLEGADWQEYRPSLTFKAKVMPEPFSVETKDGQVSGEGGDVLAVLGDDLHVFSASVFAAEYQPVVHGA